MLSKLFAIYAWIAVSQPAFVNDNKPTICKEKTNDYDCFFDAGPYKLEQGQLSGHVDALDVVTISYDLQIHGISNEEWSNIMTVSNRWTQRMPLFEFHPGTTRLRAAFSDNIDQNDGASIDNNLTFNDIHRIESTFGQNAFIIKVNNSIIKQLNDYPGHVNQKNLSIWLCSKDISCANATISNIYIISYSTQQSSLVNEKTIPHHIYALWISISIMIVIITTISIYVRKIFICINQLPIGEDAANNKELSSSKSSNSSNVSTSVDGFVLVEEDPDYDHLTDDEWTIDDGNIVYKKK